MTTIQLALLKAGIITQEEIDRLEREKHLAELEEQRKARERQERFRKQEAESLNKALALFGIDPLPPEGRA